MRRRDEFVRIVTEAGCDVSVFSLPARLSDNLSWDTQQEQIVAWLSKLPKPVGVMACHDPRGQKILEACHRANLEVPDEVAVIGVDNDEPICEISDPPLTSVFPDPCRIGYEGTRLLHQMMLGHKPDKSSVYLLPAGIVTRHSTDVLAMEDRQIAEAVSFIRKNACQGINVAEVVENTLLPRSTLYRRFREALGRSVHDEIVRVRVARAKELLGKSEMPISEVAERAGFRHQEYLGVVFKAQVGMTPGQYRRQAERGLLP